MASLTFIIPSLSGRSGGGALERLGHASREILPHLFRFVKLSLSIAAQSLYREVN